MPSPTYRSQSLACQMLLALTALAIVSCKPKDEPKDSPDAKKSDAAVATAEVQKNAEPAKAEADATAVAVGAAAGDLKEGNIRDIRSYDLGGGLKLELRYIPGGTFTMGSPVTEEGRSEYEDQVDVTLGSHYWMAKTECTQRLWKAVMTENLSLSKGEDLPAENMTWEEAVKFCEKLNLKIKLPDGWKFTLPTEAQWERACRGGTTKIFSGGDTMTGSVANMDGTQPYGVGFEGPYLKRTTKVGSYTVNAYGLDDMHGNVSEWCLDKWSDKLPGGTDPLVTTGAENVSRGGSWSDDGKDCRAAARNKVDAGVSDNNLGFRVVAVPPVRPRVSGTGQ